MFSLNVFFSNFDCRQGIPQRFISEVKTRQRGSRTHSDTELTHEGFLLVVFVVGCVNLVIVFFLLLLLQAYPWRFCYILLLAVLMFLLTLLILLLWLKMMVIIDAYDDVSHGHDNVPGEYGSGWNPQLGRFAKWSDGKLADTVVSITLQWTEVSCSCLIILSWLSW